MNLPNKITIFRMILAVIIIVLLIFPFDSVGINLPEYSLDSLNVNFPEVFVNETIVIEVKYLIAGVLFIIASITDFIDGHIARKYNMVTDFGKMMDAIADKVLVNSVLIILAATGFIHPVIPIIIIMRDTVVNSIKMIAGSKGKVVAAIKSGKIKTALLMVGIVLTLFYNMPFELWNLKVSDLLLIIASIMSLVSGFQYYYMNKSLIFDKPEMKDA